MIYEEIETCYKILPEFGKQRLLMYAESLEELSFHYVSLVENGEGVSREEKVCGEKLSENRRVISGQLWEISQMLRGLANEAYYTTKSMEKHKRKICKILKENGLNLKEMYAVANQNGYLEMGMILNACEDGDLFETEDIGEFLSKLLHNHMSVVPGMPAYIGEEEAKIVFREEVRFFMTTGVARATKEGEVSSGDNFTMTELADGTFLAVISDGMGSGERANQDSNMVVELTEQFMEAGFQKEAVANVINDLILVKMPEPRTATLDLFRCNLYSGECEFLKMGAAPSFLCTEKGVEVRMECSLPLGLVSGGRKKPETQLQGCFLNTGDVVVMLSDGVMDSIEKKAGKSKKNKNSYEYLSKILEEYDFVSCKDLANQILGMAIVAEKGKIPDDMTVLAMQLQERW